MLFGQTQKISRVCFCFCFAILFVPALRLQGQTIDVVFNQTESSFTKIKRTGFVFVDGVYVCKAVDHNDALGLSDVGGQLLERRLVSEPSAGKLSIQYSSTTGSKLQDRKRVPVAEAMPSDASLQVFYFTTDPKGAGTEISNGLAKVLRVLSTAGTGANDWSIRLTDLDYCSVQSYFAYGATSSAPEFFSKVVGRGVLDKFSPSTWSWDMTASDNMQLAFEPVPKNAFILVDYFTNEKTSAGITANPTDIRLKAITAATRRSSNPVLEKDGMWHHRFWLYVPGDFQSNKVVFDTISFGANSCAVNKIAVSVVRPFPTITWGQGGKMRELTCLEPSNLIISEGTKQLSVRWKAHGFKSTDKILLFLGDGSGNSPTPIGDAGGYDPSQSIGDGINGMCVVDVPSALVKDSRPRLYFSVKE